MHVHTPSDIPKQKPQRLRVPLVPQDNGGLLILSICFPSKTHINLNDEIVSVTLSNCSNLSESQMNSRNVLNIPNICIEGGFDLLYVFVF